MFGKIAIYNSVYYFKIPLVELKIQLLIFEW